MLPAAITPIFVQVSHIFGSSKLYALNLSAARYDVRETVYYL